MIGASRAAYHLAGGFDAAATDPGPQAQAGLRRYVEDTWPRLTRVGLSAGASRDGLTVNLDMGRVLEQADWVQQNAAERPECKIKLYAQRDTSSPQNLPACSTRSIAPAARSCTSPRS
jgi:3-hydroxyacyl-CoA dehydrogenase